MNYGLAATNYGLTATNYGLTAINYCLAAMNYWSTAMDYGLAAGNYDMDLVRYGCIIGRNECLPVANHYCTFFLIKKYKKIKAERYTTLSAGSYGEQWFVGGLCILALLLGASVYVE